jgi:hypothetical protein
MRPEPSRERVTEFEIELGRVLYGWGRAELAALLRIRLRELREKLDRLAAFDELI